MGFLVRTRFGRWFFWEKTVRIGKETNHILLALLLAWLWLGVVFKREFSLWVSTTIYIICLSGLLNVELRLYLFILWRLNCWLLRLRQTKRDGRTGCHFSAVTQFLIFFTVVGVVFENSFQVGHVEGIEKLLHRELFFFELSKEFLRVTAGLRTWASAHVLLNLFPFLSINFERL